MRSIWLFVCRLGVWVYFNLHLYKAWSSLYRAIWERSFRDVEIHTFSSVKILADYLTANASKWRADSWRQLGDAVSHPGKAQQVFDGVVKTDEGLDCDDFAVFTVSALLKSVNSGHMQPPFELTEPKLLTVMWLNGNSPGGHNVCLVKVSAGGFAYMDYGAPKGHGATPDEVARHVADVHAWGSDMIGWCVQLVDLTPELVHWG